MKIDNLASYYPFLYLVSTDDTSVSQAQNSIL